MNYLVAKRSIPLFPLEPDLICRSGAASIEVRFEDVAKDACDFHLIHWMGAKNPSPSWFCAKPLFPLFGFLWAAVGRRTGRYMHPDYTRLPECTGYSLWRKYRDGEFGPMPLADRLRWSWRDLGRAVRLFQRWIQLVLSRS